MVDQRCRESEGKVKIEGYMSISDEEAHQRPTSLSRNSSMSHHQSKQLLLPGFITHVSALSLRNCSRLATMASEFLTHKVILIYAMSVIMCGHVGAEVCSGGSAV